MNLPALEVAQYLEDNSIGIVGTDLFVDMLPDVQNDVFAVFTTGGQTPDIDLPIGSPNFELLSRSESAQTAYDLLKNAVDLLHQKMNSTLVTSGNYYYSILLNGEINSLGRDEKGRIEYSANFNCKVRGR
jgi:hypothetical protein